MAYVVYEEKNVGNTRCFQHFLEYSAYVSVNFHVVYSIFMLGTGILCEN